jgi:CheY-like chemotaxis protein
VAAPQRIISDLSPGLRNDGAKRRVLYAEDQTTTRIVTTALLERMGYDVVAVEDGELALEQAKLGSFDVILLDIEMPVMDGVTAARSIRRDVPEAKSTPILALSAFLADSTEHSIWRDAFDGAVPKPANGNELSRALQAALKPKPIATPQLPTNLWSNFALELPQGTRNLMARTAAQEMNHLVLTYASCVDAGDTAGQLMCRNRLSQLAKNFGAVYVSQLVSENTTGLQLLNAVDSWQAEQTR